LEVALGDPLVAELELLDHPAAAVVAGDDRDLDAVQVHLLEGEPGDEHDRFGHVPVAGLALVDPVAAVGRRERAPLHRRPVAPPAEPGGAAPRGVGAVLRDEDAEPEPGAQLALALAGAAPHGERLAGLHDVGQVGVAGGLPGREPPVVAPPHLLPRREVGRHQRPQRDPSSGQHRHRSPITSSRAASSRLTLRGRAVWPMQPMRHTFPATSPTPPPTPLPSRPRSAARPSPPPTPPATPTVVTPARRYPSAANSR